MKFEIKSRWNGSVLFSLETESLKLCVEAAIKAKADLQYVLEMAKDVYAIRGNLSGIDTPVWLRLYRHRDTSHLDYMTADGKYTKPAAEKVAAEAEATALAKAAAIDERPWYQRLLGL